MLALRIVPLRRRATLVIVLLTACAACGGGNEANPGQSPGNPDAGQSPTTVTVDRFVAGQLVSSNAASAIRAVATAHPRTGVVILNSDRPGPGGTALYRPAMWMLLPDGSTMQMTTEGSAAQPTVTEFRWKGHTVRLEQDGQGVRALHIGPDGKTRTFPGTAAAIRTQALSEEGPEWISQRDRTWFETARGNFVVDAAFNAIEALRATGEAVREQFKALREKLPTGHTVVTAETITETGPSTFTEQNIVELARELEARLDNRKPATGLLPEVVSRRDEMTQQVVPATWPAPRVPCLKDWHSNGILAMIQHACAASADACTAAGGYPADRRPDCDQWCARLGGLAPVEFANYDRVLSCHRNQCVTAFDTTTTFKPLEGDAACMAQCKTDYCGTGACETKVINYMNQTLYLCENDSSKGDCETPHFEEKYWPGKTCVNLGYTYYDAASEKWRLRAGNNAMPGTHGEWGDKTASGTVQTSGPAPGRDGGVDADGAGDAGAPPPSDGPPSSDATCKAYWKPILVSSGPWRAVRIFQSGSVNGGSDIEYVSNGYTSNFFEFRNDDTMNYELFLGSVRQYHENSPFSFTYRPTAQGKASCLLNYRNQLGSPQEFALGKFASGQLTMYWVANDGAIQIEWTLQRR